MTSWERVEMTREILRILAYATTVATGMLAVLAMASRFFSPLLL
jgi:hypothetical protein